MGCRFPAGDGCDRMQPSAKSEASAPIVRGRSGWKCWRIGAVVKAYCRDRKVASAANDQANLIPFRVSVVRGLAR